MAFRNTPVLGFCSLKLTLFYKINYCRGQKMALWFFRINILKIGSKSQFNQFIVIMQNKIKLMYFL
jgi:hypothetical protein